MIHYRQAQEIVIREAHSFGKETIGLEKAPGRVIAETVIADRDYPPFNRSTMDGYALRTADLRHDVRVFQVVETIFAGAGATRPASPGECYKIMTGAPVPDPMDIVLRKEDTKEENGVMRLTDLAGQTPAGPMAIAPTTLGPSPFSNIARRGEDLRGGETILDRPAVCDPSLVGLLATLGKKELTVEALPRVSILTTGNEVVPVEADPGAAEIRNSNRWLIGALLKNRGIYDISYQHAGDDPAVLEKAVGSALSRDLLILSGGVSAGDADHVPSVMEAIGVKQLFHKIAIRPGKPVWCGVAPSGTMVFALPGNPFSCLVNFVLLIKPFLNAAAGLSFAEPAGLPLASFRKKRVSLDEFFPVNLSGSPARLVQKPLNSSGDIRLGLSADGLALHAADSGDLSEGANVLYFPF